MNKIFVRKRPQTSHNSTKKLNVLNKEKMSASQLYIEEDGC